MGFQDRDYYRVDYEPRRAGSAVGSLSMWSVTTWLIVINVAVFVLDQILFRAGIAYPQIRPVLAVDPAGQQVILNVRTLTLPLEGLGHFSVSQAVFHFEIWRFITFQFLHAGIGHLLFNMIALYFFGPLVESYFGARRFIAFYLLSGIGGPIVYTLLMILHVLIPDATTPLVGASAGIFGILIAAAQIAPDTTVLLYGAIPMKLKTLAWVLLGIAVYTVLQYGSVGQQNAGGQAAHLGGAAVGYLLVRNPRLLSGVRVGRLFGKRPPPF